jgi:hypothetical protein
MFFDTVYDRVTQAGLKLSILLPEAPEKPAIIGMGHHTPGST